MKEVSDLKMAGGSHDAENSIRKMNLAIKVKEKSDLEQVRKCNSGDLGRCDEVTDEMPIRSSQGIIQNVWLKNKNIRVADLDFGKCLAEDGRSIKLRPTSPEK